MKRAKIKRLIFLCEIVPFLLEGINEEEFLQKATPEKWSKKEILGY